MTLEQKMREKYNEGKAEGIVDLMWSRISKNTDEIAEAANITVDQAKEILRNLGYIKQPTLHINFNQHGAAAL